MAIVVYSKRKWCTFGHRDYSGFSGGIVAHVYPNRLEIWNSGPLPDGITPAMLAEGYLSILRNLDIAHVLYLRGRMEKVGRGSLLILRLCQEAGLPNPIWESDQHRARIFHTFWGNPNQEIT